MTFDGDTVREAIIRELGWQPPLTPAQQQRGRELLHGVERYRQVWPYGGPADTVIAEQIAHLHLGRLNTALVRLIRTEDKAPSIARLIREYEAVDLKRRAPTGVVCGDCEGSGWVTADDAEINGHTYTNQVDKCACQRGAPPAVQRDAGEVLGAAGALRTFRARASHGDTEAAVVLHGLERWMRSDLFKTTRGEPT